MSEPVVNHRMKVMFNHGWPTFTLVCDAPLESMCHAKFDCTCENWEADGVEEGLPWHANYDYIADNGEPMVKHWGEFDPDDCGYRHYIDDLVSEVGEGEIEFPITINWDGDGYTWRVAELCERFVKTADGYRVAGDER